VGSVDGFTILEGAMSVTGRDSIAAYIQIKIYPHCSVISECSDRKELPGLEK
jgi:hypothetical protein